MVDHHLLYKQKSTMNRHSTNNRPTNCCCCRLHQSKARGVSSWELSKTTTASRLTDGFSSRVPGFLRGVRRQKAGNGKQEGIYRAKKAYRARRKIDLKLEQLTPIGSSSVPKNTWFALIRNSRRRSRSF